MAIREGLQWVAICPTGCDETFGGNLRGTHHVWKMRLEVRSPNYTLLSRSTKRLNDQAVCVWRAA